jgi:hypothetical protein
MSGSVMTDAFAVFGAAAHAGAQEIEERPGDRYRSFLESTLEDALVQHLPPTAETDQSRRRLALEGFEPRPNGVDIDWQHASTRAGVETKVSDVLDSLFDVVKLATAIAHGHFDQGYCAIAADADHWARGGVVSQMCRAPAGEWCEHAVDELLVEPAARKAVLVTKGPRPHTVPGRIETMAVEPIAMPKAPTHKLRLLAVRPVTSTAWLELPRRSA